MAYKFWTTKEGLKIPINKMENSHLLNTIKMIERTAEREHQLALNMGYQMSCTLQGEMAIDEIESKLSFLEENGPQYPGIYWDMKQLAVKRNLLPKD